MALLLKSNSIYNGKVEDLPKILTLDLHSNSFSSFGLRKLNSDYDGNAIEVRRSSDNSLLQIGFKYNKLDIEALLSFVGSGDGYIKTWFDQSGNGRNLNQVIESSQPKIVSAGMLKKINGIPAIYFDGLDSYFNASNLVGALKEASRSYITAVAKSDSSASPTQNLISLSVDGGSNARLSIDYNSIGGSNKIRVVARRLAADMPALALSSSTHDSEPKVVTADADWEGGLLYCRENGVVTSTVMLASAGVQPNKDSYSAYVGQSNTGDSRFGGLISEMHIYNYDKSNSINYLEKDMEHFMSAK